MALVYIQGAEEKKQGIHYEVDLDEKPLGVGGMGQVYKGVRVDERRGDRMEVAIKFLFDDLPENIIDRARREASVKIHNENLVEMFGFIHIDEEIAPGKYHPRYHVVSELLHGVMLHDLLNGKFTDYKGEEIAFAKELYEQYVNDRYAFTVFITKNILSGIMAMHDNGYIHRDLDPSNVMITSNGKVKIIDYGITKKLTALSTTDKQLTTAGHFMGKAAFAAPELVVGDILHQNQTTDIYAIGIMLFQFITGELPFDGSTHEVLDMQLHNKMPIEKIQNKHLRRIIAKATAKKQIDRYQSAAEFRVAMEQFGAVLQNGDVAGDSEGSSIAEKAKTIFTKRPVIIGVISAVCLLVVACIVVMQVSKHNTNKEQEQIIAERIEMLKDAMFDSLDPLATEKDEISNFDIKSVGWWIEKAKTDLLSDEAQAAEGLSMLQKIVNMNLKSSSEAAYLLGRIYYENEQPDSLITAMKLNLGANLVSNNRKAHEMNLKAIQLDSTCYKGLYELGCDYFAGEYRTGREDSRNVSAAISCFRKGLKYAAQAKDADFENKCRKRLEELEVE